MQSINNILMRAADAADHTTDPAAADSIRLQALRLAVAYADGQICAASVREIIDEAVEAARIDALSGLDSFAMHGIYLQRSGYQLRCTEPYFATWVAPNGWWLIVEACDDVDDPHIVTVDPEDLSTERRHRSLRAAIQRISSLT